MTEPGEIAAGALFLASKQVVTLTGAEIDVNGGTCMQTCIVFLEDKKLVSVPSSGS